MIGVFDSGVGGLTVLKELRMKMPQADLVYFGDIANAPYGQKSPRQLAILISGALRRLHQAGATDIVSACNSVSAAMISQTIDLLRVGIFDLVEMVEPSVEALKNRKEKIAVLATSATINSKIYQEAFTSINQTITAIAAPELASLIETGASKEKIKSVVEKSLLEPAKADAQLIALCCTHYPLAIDVFEQVTKERGNDFQFFNPASAVAEACAKRFSAKGNGNLRVILSADSIVFRSWLSKLLPSENPIIEISPSIYSSLKSAA